jgi:hypothetical protein
MTVVVSAIADPSSDVTLPRSVTLWVLCEVLAWSAVVGEDAFNPTCDIRNVEKKITGAAERSCDFMILLSGLCLLFRWWICLPAK